EGHAAALPRALPSRCRRAPRNRCRRAPRSRCRRALRSRSRRALRSRCRRALRRARHHRAGRRRHSSEVTAQTDAALERLDQITRRLRRECPWDREQDERSIVPHTVEEAYELADAAHAGDDAKLHDELGDVLFQVHFLALLLEERGAGSIDDVAQALIATL